MLLTRPPLNYNEFHPKTSSIIVPFDLHVLGAPPAFVLSQDQTLCKNGILNLTSQARPKIFTSVSLAHKFLAGSVLAFTEPQEFSKLLKILKGLVSL